MVPRAKAIGYSSGSATRLQLRQQAKDLQIEPHERHQQPKRSVPLHVFRRPTFRTLLYEVEIQHQVEGSDDDDKDAEEDAERAAGVDQRYAYANESQG